MTKEQELAKLKKEAIPCYREALAFDDLSCGRHMAEYIRPSIHMARQRFNEVWSRIQELDPKAPENPFKDIED